MKTIIFFLAISFLLAADSVKVDLTVTFHDLTLEQATELEKIINKDFKDYNFEISIPTANKYYPFYYDCTLPYDTTGNLNWINPTGVWEE